MQAILDAPVTACGAGEAFHAERQAAEIIMHFDLRAALDRATTDDRADGLRRAPTTERGGALRKGQQILAAFLGAASFLLAFDVFDQCWLQAGCGSLQRLLEGLANLGVQLGLVVFQVHRGNAC